jgi:hypothetical protein
MPVLVQLPPGLAERSAQRRPSTVALPSTTPS